MKHVLVSWKMYPTVDEARALFEALQAGLRERAERESPLPRLIVCPPYVALVPIRAMADDRLVRLGAQNCHWEQEGSFTGEISPRMLEDLVDYVMLGHSERRAMGETDDQIARKVSAAVDVGLIPILLVGEDDRDQDAIRLTEQRLRQGLSLIDVATHDFLVVYEPTWAIGAKEAAPPEHIERAVAHLKGVLTELGARQPSIIYGGTVNESNIDDLLALEVLDGIGATRASLDTDGFLRMIDCVGAASAGG